MLTPIEILKTLVAIPSVSSMTNKPVIDAITDLLEPHGWHVERFPHTAQDGLDEGEPGCDSVHASLPISAGQVDLLFVCHTDTVPYQKWMERRLPS